MAPLERQLAAAAAHRERSGRPLVTLSYAQSLDGSLSVARGTQTAISGPESLAVTHSLRAAHDAIAVGIGTLLADDPQLSVRLADGRNPQPVILDSQLRTPANAAVLQSNPAPWVFCVNDAAQEKEAQLAAAGARITRLAADEDGHVALFAFLDQLGHWGVNSLMVEGGAALITSFLQRGLADQVAITIAPVFIGGLKAVEALADLAAFPRIAEPQVERFGDDFVVWGELA
jgi:riboflavin-specific deaminase-like protein